MVSVPIPTFVPQDAWYNLTVGAFTPSVANPIPAKSYLQPALQAGVLVNGLVGSFDGALIYLAGLVTELDGGQKWLLWNTNSLEVDDGVNTFNPFAVTSTPGRWLNAFSGTQIAAQVQATQIIPAGGSSAIAAATTSIVNVFVKGGAGTKTLVLPVAAFNGQTFNVKDANGIAGVSPITVTAASIDGRTSDVIAVNYGSQSYVWNATEWSIAGG